MAATGHCLTFRNAVLGIFISKLKCICANAICTNSKRREHKLNKGMILERSHRLSYESRPKYLLLCFICRVGCGNK